MGGPLLSFWSNLPILFLLTRLGRYSLLFADFFFVNIVNPFKIYQFFGSGFCLTKTGSKNHPSRPCLQVVKEYECVKHNQVAASDADLRMKFKPVVYKKSK